MKINQLSIDSRNFLESAIADYMEARANFEKASLAFSEACAGMRAALRGEAKFLVTFNNERYLVTSDKEGNFEVEGVDAL